MLFPFQTAKVASSRNPSRPGKFLPTVGSLDRTRDDAEKAFEKRKKEKISTKKYYPVVLQRGSTIGNLRLVHYAQSYASYIQSER
jgi:hypothetical protein